MFTSFTLGLCDMLKGSKSVFYLPSRLLHECRISDFGNNTILRHSTVCKTTDVIKFPLKKVPKTEAKRNKTITLTRTIRHIVFYSGV